MYSGVTWASLRLTSHAIWLFVHLYSNKLILAMCKTKHNICSNGANKGLHHHVFYLYEKREMRAIFVMHGVSKLVFLNQL